MQAPTISRFDAISRLLPILINPFDRWPVRRRLFVGTAVALMAILVVGLLSLTLIARERLAVADLALLSRAQRLLQDADMQHDAIRSEVLSLLLEPAPSTRSTRELQQQIGAYRGFISEAQALSLPLDLRKAISDVEPELDAYLAIAASTGHAAVHDRASALPYRSDFEAAFTRLAATNKALTDLVAGRVAFADQAAAAAARASFGTISSVLVGAFLIVAFVSREVARSIAIALDGVRNAAESIALGDLSVRSHSPVRDEIGAVGAAVNRMADSLQQMIGQLQSEQELDVFSRQLSEALEMADTEADTHYVVSRGMHVAAPDMAMELLIADSSRAHLERATAHPTQGAPGCGVESPYSCMAVRRGNRVVFDSSEALNACSKLRGRACGPVSAVCVPLSFMGRAIGVLHAAGPAGVTPPDRLVNQLTTLGILAGSRIGTVRAFQRTQIQASTDALTGLPNRRALEARVRQFTPGASYALLLIDLDHFKRLNDTHGHDAGDRALRVFADVLRRSVREDDHAARWGGEEFAVVLEQRNAAAAVPLADRVKANLEVACRMRGVPAVTASFGIADSTMAASFDQIVRIADDALYQSKEAGRDCATIADPSRTQEHAIRRNTEQLASIDVSRLADESGR